jgi:hypothetical protein
MQDSFIDHGYTRTSFLGGQCKTDLANVFLLLYVRALLLNEPFVITVDTSVAVTMELLLLPMQRFICSVSMEASLLDSKHVTILLATAQQ